MKQTKSGKIGSEKGLSNDSTPILKSVDREFEFNHKIRVLVNLLSLRELPHY